MLVLLVVAACGIVAAVLLAMSANGRSGMGIGSPTDSRWRTPVIRALENTERDYRVLEWYPPEPVVGARIYDYGVWAEVGWRPPGNYSPLNLTDDELRRCRAIRVRYESDEGFGRKDLRDKVFIVNDAGRVLRGIETSSFSIGKPKQR